MRGLQIRSTLRYGANYYLYHLKITVNRLLALNIYVVDVSRWNTLNVSELSVLFKLVAQQQLDTMTSFS